MLNKKTAWVIVVIIFFLSVVTSYFFIGKIQGGQGFLSPLSLYQAPKSNTNNNDIANSEPKTEECPLNGELLTKSQKAKWEVRRPLGIMIDRFFIVKIRQLPVR